MTIRVSTTPTLALQGLSASAPLSDEVANLAEAVDSEIIQRAVALAELLKIGAASCRDVDEYNRIAGEAWRVQIEFFDLLIAGGGVNVDSGGTIRFPNHPPLFLVDGGRFNLRCVVPGRNCAFVESVCRDGAIDPTLRVVVQDKAQEILFLGSSGGFPSGGLDGLGVFAALPSAVRAGIWIVGTLAATTAVVGLTAAAVMSQTEEAKLNKARVEFAKVRAKINADKSAHVLECRKAGRSASECEAEAERLFPDPPAPSSTPGLGDELLGTVVKFGAVFLAGSFIYKKIQEY